MVVRSEGEHCARVGKVRPRPNFAGAAERGAGAVQDGDGRAGCARFRLASLPHAARPHALPVGRARVE